LARWAKRRTKPPRRTKPDASIWGREPRRFLRDGYRGDSGQVFAAPGENLAAPLRGEARSPCLTLGIKSSYTDGSITEHGLQIGISPDQLPGRPGL
jgi:hypothetical protein